MKTAIYIRVSTHHQIDKDSLPLQRNELVNYSKYILGCNDFEIFEDAGYSGKNTERPGFQDMMTRAKAKEFTHILVWKIDRISRNLIDFATMYEEMKSYGITFISKNEQFDTSTAMGEAMLKIILIFAELERKLAAERVYATMLSRAEKGLWNGANVPLGYKWSDEENYPVICPVEAPTVEYIYKEYEKLRSSTQVMELLNKNNIKTKRGGMWTTKTIADIIRNPFYKGTYRYNYREGARGEIKPKDEWILIDNNHPGIIDLEQWEICNAIMDENANKNTSFYRKNRNIHLFSGLLSCSRCGKGFIANLDAPRQDGFQPSTYRCQSRVQKQPCSSTKIATDVKIAPLVFQYIANLVRFYNNPGKITSRSLERYLLDSKSLSGIASIVGLESIFDIRHGNVTFKNEKKQDKGKVIDIQLDLLEKEREKQTRALDRLDSLYLYSDDSISEKDYLIKKKEITTEIEEIEYKIKESYKKETTSYDNRFLETASYFILNNEFMNKKNVNYKKMIMNSDKQLIQDFLNLVLDKVYIDNNVVTAIRFKNGMLHEFLYKSSLQ